MIAGQGAGGGSHAGSGGRKEPNGGSGQLSDHAISGQTYGTIDIDALLAGSGGGGGKLANGGSGGGAIKITAGGTLTLNSEISAVGGRVEIMEIFPTLYLDIVYGTTLPMSLQW